MKNESTFALVRKMITDMTQQKFGKDRVRFALEYFRVIRIEGDAISVYIRRDPQRHVRRRRLGRRRISKQKIHDPCSARVREFERDRTIGKRYDASLGHT